jgi:cytochrome b561
MAIKSSDNRYGTVAIILHWSVALAIIALLFLGFRAAGTQNEALKAGLLRAHVSLGILTLLLTAVRIVWWVFLDRKPAPVEGTPAWQEYSARAVHFLFYVVIIGMAFSGIGMVVLSGAFPVLFGSSGKTLPDFWITPPRAAHGLGAYLLCVMIALHVAAAAYHQLIRRDALLSRIGLGRSPMQSLTSSRKKQ